MSATVPPAKRQPASVLVIADFGGSGGTRTFFLKVMSVLAGLPVRPCVLLTPAQADRDVRGCLEAHGIPYRTVWTWPQLRPALLGKLHARFPFGALCDLVLWSRYLRGGRADAVLISTGTPGRWLALFRRAKKALYVLHTVPDRRLDRASRWLLSRRASGTRRFLTVSDYARTRLLERWLGVAAGTRGAPAVAVVHNCSDVPDGPPAPRQLACPKRVLTLGHVTAHKNPDFWIEVAAAVRAKFPGERVEFVWAGDGDRLEHCRREVTRRRLDGVSFLGLQHDVKRLFDGCWVYFQPSLIENHSIAVVTAMQMAVPCVVSDVGGSPESVLDRETGFVVPMDGIDPCVEALSALLRDPSLNERQGRAGQVRYYSVFSERRWHAQIESELQRWLA